jgi:hypothetical protein
MSVTRAEALLSKHFGGLEFAEDAFPLRTHDPSAAKRTATLTGGSRYRLAGRKPQARPFELVTAPMLRYCHTSIKA